MTTPKGTRQASFHGDASGFATPIVWRVRLLFKLSENWTT